MNANVTPMPAPPAPVEKKRRTITLTNRAPIQIVEDEWPVIAQGLMGDHHPDAPWGWTIEIRVRREGNGGIGRVLIHGKYNAHNEIDDNDNQTVRVGRIINDRDALQGLWQHILDVGEEMRSRIEEASRQKYVTLALDHCFASMKPMTY